MALNKSQDNGQKESEGFFSVCTNNKDYLYPIKTDGVNTGTSEEWRCTQADNSMQPGLAPMLVVVWQLLLEESIPSHCFIGFHAISGPCSRWWR